MDEQNNVALQSDPRTRPMTFEDWIKTLLLIMIPVAGFVLMIIWAFSDEINISKRNFFRAYLLIMLIIVGLVMAINLLVFLIIKNAVRHHHL